MKAKPVIVDELWIFKARGKPYSFMNGQHCKVISTDEKRNMPHRIRFIDNESEIDVFDDELTLADNE